MIPVNPMGKMFRAVRSAVRKYFVNSCFINKKVIMKIIKRSLLGKTARQICGGNCHSLSVVSCFPIFPGFTYYSGACSNTRIFYGKDCADIRDLPL